VPYFVNVTVFDFGSPMAELAPLETSVIHKPIMAYALDDPASVEAKKLEVYVYPNPYRVDGDYLEHGYEGRNALYHIPERLRRVHFANLPSKCTIRIHSLDGDLIRELEHDVPADDPTASHHTWDLISRNQQLVVTGLYYWTVEQPDGPTQIGKLVILK
jgi:hypothetical protein